VNKRRKNTSLDFGARRIEIAMELSDMVKELAMAGFKQQYPKASKNQLRNLWAKEMSLPY
jgi:hypothetical protein